MSTLFTIFKVFAFCIFLAVIGLAGFCIVVFLPVALCYVLPFVIAAVIWKVARG